MKRCFTFFQIISLLLMAMIFAASCSDKPSEPVNLPPQKPSIPVPANLSGNITQNGMQLQWSCVDPEGEQLSYEIYLGTDPNPPRVIAFTTQNTFSPGFLQGDAVYYWRVVAQDGSGNYTGSPIWSFSTVPARDFIYPLAVENFWAYDHHYWSDNFIPDRLGEEYYFEYFATSAIKVDSMTILEDGCAAYCFDIDYSSQDEVLSETKLYAGHEDGLYYYGTVGFSAGITNTPAPVRNRHFYIFSGIRYDNLTELFSNYIPDMTGISGISRDGDDDYPLVSLVYPLHIGKQWTFRDFTDWVPIDKKVIGWESVHVPAGDFDCFKIKWLYGKDEDGLPNLYTTVIDYIGAVGLVKREICFEKVAVGSYEHPLGIGTVDIHQEYELTEYVLR